MVHEIPDHLRENLLLLFVGYNPSIRSGETGHHYANPHNRFWTILHRSGLTSRKYTAQEDQDLLDIGYGFTNIVARPTRTAAEITKEEYKEGKRLLQEKISLYKPQIVCFVGKGVYEQYSGRRQVSWGIQHPPVVENVIEFVGPSSSGLVRMRIEEIIDIYRELAHLVIQKSRS